MDKTLTFEEFLDLWYRREIGMNGLIRKDDPYLLARTDYFDPKYSAKIEAWAVRADTLYKLLPKTTYVERGDSIKFIGSDPYVYSTTSALRPLQETTALYTSVDTDVPDVTDLNYIEPGYVDLPWKISMQAQFKAGWTAKPNFTPELIQKYNMERYVQLLDAQLLQTVDTATAYVPDSLDRIISSKAEDDSAWIDDGDCDLWRTQGSKSIDRDAATTYDAQCDLPETEANRSLTLDMIDDIMATAKKYGSGNYIVLTNDDTINAIQKLVDPKGRMLHGESEVEYTQSGVVTRRGHGGGRIPVASIITNGLTIPVFSDPNVAVPISGGAGNLYFIDLDHIELRVAMPISYFHTDFGQDFLRLDYPQVYHDIIFGGNLIADRFNCHAAIKCIAKG